MKRRINTRFFVAVLLLIPLALMIQQFIGLPGLKSLKGAFTKEPTPQLTFNHWLDGSFQSQFERYSNQNFGYRSTAVRIHNQIKHSIFNQSTNTGIYRNKNNYLIGYDYLEAYKGDDFIGYKKIDEKCQLLKQASDYMEENGKLLMIVIAADKTSYYPEEFGLPPYSTIDSTNYKTWVSLLNQYEIPYIDFRKVFVEAKDTTKYPLFPKTGIHWSIYGMRYAMDSVAGFVSSRTGRPISRMKVKKVTVSKNYQDIEYDIENALNLFFRFKKPALGYQVFSITNPKKPLPKMLVISDSFFYELYSSGMAANFMDTPQFWYYNKEAMKWGEPNLDKDATKYQLDSVVNATDVIWLMATDPNLDDFPWGFQTRFKDEVLMKKDSVIKQ